MELKSVFVLLLLLFAFIPARAAEVKVPTVTINTRFIPTFVNPTSPQNCRDLFATGAGISPEVRSAWKETVRIVKAANKEFLRRGWTKKFLTERKRLAWNVRDRSFYVGLAKSSERGASTDNLVGTLAVTWAEYHRQSMPRMDQPVSGESRGQFLPGEISLESKPFPRPVTSRGDGVIMELRTWSIDKDNLSVEERGVAFAELFAAILPNVYEKIGNRPELLDQPILYTYGNETSLKLYGRMGFKNLWKESGPIFHENENWWLLAITPRQLERFISRVQDPELLYDLNQDLEVSLTQGRFKIAKDGVVLKIGPQHELSATQGVYALAEKTQVMPGLWIEKGGHILWHGSNLRYVGPIAEPYILGGGLVAGKGAFIGWHPSDGSLLEVSHLLNGGVEIEKDLVAAAGADVSWSIYNGQRLAQDVTRIEKPFMILPGVWAAPGSAVAWYPSYSGERKVRTPLAVTRLLENAQLPDGAVAAAGSMVQWRETSHGRSEWEYISKLAEPLPLPDGRIAPAGSSVDRRAKSSPDGRVIITLFK